MRAGLMLGLDVIDRILRRVGFSEARQVPEHLQLDPLYYELHFAEKK